MDGTEKDDLIREEADMYLEREECPGGYLMHTIKNGILSATAGIDGSNSGEYYILWPKDSMRSAQEIRQWIEQTYSIKNIAIIINDSRTYPFRRGTAGIALGWAGIKPLNDYRGTQDLFGHTLVISQSNIVDCLASAGVFVMGEGAESTPVVLVRGYDIQLIRNHDEKHDHFNSVVVPMEEDVYRNMFMKAPWKKGGGGVK